MIADNRLAMRHQVIFHELEALDELAEVFISDGDAGRPMTLSSHRSRSSWFVLLC